MNNGRAGNSKANGEITPGEAKAWVVFKGAATQAGVVILASHNVASVRRDGLGTYTITFMRPFKTPNFGYFGNGKAVGAGSCVVCAASTDPGSAGAKQIVVVNPTVTPYDAAETCFIAYGAQ